MIQDLDVGHVQFCSHNIEEDSEANLKHLLQFLKRNLLTVGEWPEFPLDCHQAPATSGPRALSFSSVKIGNTGQSSLLLSFPADCAFADVRAIDRTILTGTASNREIKRN